MRALAARLRAMYAARQHHFTPPGGLEPAFSVIATEARLRDLLQAAQVIEQLDPAPAPLSGAADSEGGERD